MFFKNKNDRKLYKIKSVGKKEVVLERTISKKIDRFGNFLAEKVRGKYKLEEKKEYKRCKKANFRKCYTKIEGLEEE